MPDYTAELSKAKTLMAELLAHVRSFDTRRFQFVAPVIDQVTDLTWRGEGPLGLLRLVEVLEKSAAALSLSDASPIDDPLPLVLTLVTSWKVVACARAPVTAIRFTAKGHTPPPVALGKQHKSVSKKSKETFVDCVAQGGREWIRVYSIKTSQLLNECREQDAVLSDSSDDEETARAKAASTPRPLNNSITRLVDCLLELASNVEHAPGCGPPRITLRLSRIEEFAAHPDDRIPATFDYVRSRGVNLVFGDLSEVPLSSIPTAIPTPRKLRPSRCIALDPTALMGLCSDLVHFPLPKSEEEARARYYRPATAEASDGSEVTQSKNSRDLVEELVDEMAAPVVELIRDVLDEVVTERSEPIEFWTTRNAIKYIQETISSDKVIGVGGEQRRMRCLTGLEEGDFWAGSRYEGKTGALAGLKLHVFEDELDEGDASREPLCLGGMTSFHKSTAAIAAELVADYHQSIKQKKSKAAAKEAAKAAATSGTTATAARSDADPTTSTATANGADPTAPPPSMINLKRLPAPRVADISTPLPVVSLECLARAAAEGMTTLSMGHVVFRDLFAQRRWRFNGWSQGCYELEDTLAAGKRGTSGFEASTVIGGDAAATPGPANAVAWLLSYRLLGEGKRIKFARGDYSLPNFVNRGPAATKAALAAREEA